MKKTNVITHKTNLCLDIMITSRDDLTVEAAEKVYSDKQRVECDSETIDPQIRKNGNLGECYYFGNPDELKQFHEDNDEPDSAWVVAIINNPAKYGRARPNEKTRQAYHHLKSEHKDPYFGKWSKDEVNYLDISYLELNLEEAKNVAEDNGQTAIIKITKNQDGELRWKEILTREEVAAQV